MSHQEHSVDDLVNEAQNVRRCKTGIQVSVVAALVTPAAGALALLLGYPPYPTIAFKCIVAVLCVVEFVLGIRIMLMAGRLRDAAKELETHLRQLHSTLAPGLALARIKGIGGIHHNLWPTLEKHAKEVGLIAPPPPPPSKAQKP